MSIQVIEPLTIGQPSEALRAKFDYATQGQHLADVRAAQDREKAQAKWAITPEQRELLADLIRAPRRYEIYGPDAQRLRVLAGQELATIIDTQRPFTSTWHATASAYGLLGLDLPTSLSRERASYQQAYDFAHSLFTLTPAPVAALLPMSKFIVSSSALLKTLQSVSPAIVHNPVVPVLDNFLFSITGNTLHVTGSDLEVSITATVLVETNAGAIDICVPASILLNLLKQLPDQPVTFDVDEHEHRVQVRTANGVYKLSGQEPREYPKVPKALASTNALEIPSDALARAVGKTIFAISTDELRPAMTGVLLQLETDRLTFVATDGHRLLRYRRLDVGGGVARNVIIPRKAWALLKSILPSEGVPVSLTLSESNAFFSFHNLHLVTRLIDERYPDYDNVIPVSNPNQLLINRLELLHAVRRCALTANKTTYQLRLALEPASVVISAEDLDFSNESRETLACQYDGANMEIGFNARFLIEMLSNMNCEEVRLTFSNPSRAGILEPAQQGEDENVLMLVMPVMLNNYV